MVYINRRDRIEIGSGPYLEAFWYRYTGLGTQTCKTKELEKSKFNKLVVCNHKVQEDQKTLDYITIGIIRYITIY